MFGLENQNKKKNAEAFTFDLERELMKEKSSKELKQKCDDKVQKIKDVLRSGDSKEEFDLFGVLLHGYTSLQKVIQNFPKGLRCLGRGVF